MILLLLLGLAVPLLLGWGALKIFCGKSSADFGWEDWLPIGICVWIGGWEISHLAGVFLGMSLTKCARLGAVLTGTAAAVVFLWALSEFAGGRRDRAKRSQRERERVRRKMEQKPWTALEQGLALFFGVSVLLQLILVGTGQYVDWSGDMTLETVRTFLSADGIYTRNPLTGGAYEIGIPLRIKILVLPTLYGALCRLTGTDPAYLTGRFVPVLVLLAFYCVYYGLSKVLFRDRRRERWIFMNVAALLIWVGDYLWFMDGFQLMHGGYRGTAFRAGILLPLVLSLSLRGKWGLTVLCVLAEACVVWTLYGAGACLLMAVLFFALECLRRRRKV